MLQCQKCGTQFPDGTARCPGCGSKISKTAATICEYCGSPVYRGTRNCEACGAPLPVVFVPEPKPEVQTVQKVYVQVPAPNVSDRNRWIALLLAIFLGGFGVHRFYAGKIGTGILWLFTGGCFGIGWFIDCLCILFGWFSDREGRRLK